MTRKEFKSGLNLNYKGTKSGLGMGWKGSKPGLELERFKKGHKWPDKSTRVISNQNLKINVITLNVCLENLMFYFLMPCVGIIVAIN